MKFLETYFPQQNMNFNNNNNNFSSNLNINSISYTQEKNHLII